MIDILAIARYFNRKSTTQILLPILSSGSFEAFVVDLNTNDQLFKKNEDSLGIKLYEIGGEYSATTQVIKGVSGTNVTLFNEGDYYDSFAVDPYSNGKGFKIESDPFKTDENGNTSNLEDRYGKNISGLQKENLKKVNDFIIKEIFKQLAKEAR